MFNSNVGCMGHESFAPQKGRLIMCQPGVFGVESEKRVTSLLRHWQMYHPISLWRSLNPADLLCRDAGVLWGSHLETNCKQLQTKTTFYKGHTFRTCSATSDKHLKSEPMFVNVTIHDGFFQVIVLATYHRYLDNQIMDVLLEVGEKHAVLHVWPLVSRLAMGAQCL